MLALVVMTAGVSLIAGRAEAQHTGLFPLAPIRRQRVPCDQEPPIFKVYKQQYFGYYPTNWQPFPAGWGTPSPEAPDRARSLREIQPGTMVEEGGPLGPAEDEFGAPLPARGPVIPNLPREEAPSPFDMPEEGNRPGANPLPPGNLRPRTPAAEPSPFEDLNTPPQGAAINEPRAGSGQPFSPALPDAGTPELSAPGDQAVPGTASRSMQGRTYAENAPGDEEPLLGLTDADIVRSDTRSVENTPYNADPRDDSTVFDAPAPQPRRRFFGNLFSNLGAGWKRR